MSGARTPQRQTGAERNGQWRLPFVLVALLVAAALIAVPWVMGVPSAGEVCNAGSFERRDELDAEKADAARINLVGALLASIAATVAFVSTAQNRPRGRRRAMFVLGVDRRNRRRRGPFCRALGLRRHLLTSSA
jgi:hypothetical protein